MSDFIEDVRKIVNEMLDDLSKAGDELEDAGKEFDELLTPVVDAVIGNADAIEEAGGQAQRIVEGVFEDFVKMAESLEEAGKELSDLAEPLVDKIVEDIKEANTVHEKIDEAIGEVLTREPVTDEDIEAAAEEAAAIAAAELGEDEPVGADEVAEDAPCGCADCEDDTAADANE